MPLKDKPGAAIPLWDPNNHLFEEPEKVIKCIACGTMYKSETQTMVWEIANPRYKGLCYECYKKDLNTNFSEKDAEEFAKWSIQQADFEPSAFWPCHPDVDFENHQKYVVPKIEEMVAERKKIREEKYHQEKLEEAQRIIDNAKNVHPNGNMNPDWFELEIIATLLERIDKLERKTSQNLYDVKFGV